MIHGVYHTYHIQYMYRMCNVYRYRMCHTSHGTRYDMIRTRVRTQLFAALSNTSVVQYHTVCTSTVV